jgi:hypothetical protein
VESGIHYDKRFGAVSGDSSLVLHDVRGLVSPDVRLHMLGTVGTMDDSGSHYDTRCGMSCCTFRFDFVRQFVRQRLTAGVQTVGTVGTIDCMFSILLTVHLHCLLLLCVVSAAVGAP